MDNPEIRARLQKAANLDEVKAILTEAGTDYTPEEAERILQEIEHHRPSGKRKLDPDEMDAVAGGADRNWVDDGCAATCEDGSHCWTSATPSCWTTTFQRPKNSRWRRRRF